RLHHADPRRKHGLHRQRRLPQLRHLEQRAVRSRVRNGSRRRDGDLPGDRPPAGCVRGAMNEGRLVRSLLAVWVVLVLLFLIVPIALPGIITGVALNSFFSFVGWSLSYWTIVIGHATFCVVIVYNNLLARLRRTQTSLIEASMDLGADGWQTFRFVTFPVVS